MYIHIKVQLTKLHYFYYVISKKLIEWVFMAHSSIQYPIQVICMSCKYRVVFDLGFAHLPYLFAYQFPYLFYFFTYFYIFYFRRPERLQFNRLQIKNRVEERKRVEAKPAITPVSYIRLEYQRFFYGHLEKLDRTHSPALSAVIWCVLLTRRICSVTNFVAYKNYINSGPEGEMLRKIIQ